MAKWSRFIICGLCCGLLALAVGCDRGGGKKVAAGDKNTAPTATTAAQQEPPSINVEGTVAEVLEGGGFTFMKIKTAAGEKWASVPQIPVKKGDRVKLISAFPFPNFHSKSLDRTFKEMIFASGIEGRQPTDRPHLNTAKTADAAPDKTFAAALAREGKNAAATSGSGSAAAVVNKKSAITVDRAPGANGFTVAELFARAADLDGKKVLLNAKVVKVSRNIMGRNWVHLQDGTGSATDKNHDLVVTTAETPEMDSMVQVEGTMKANRDFGSGYRYAALVEGAKFKKLSGE